MNYPSGSVQRELGEIAYMHDKSYSEAVKHSDSDPERADMIIREADEDMIDNIANIRSKFRTDAWQYYIGDLGIKSKMAIESVLQPVGINLYDGTGFFRRSDRKKNIRAPYKLTAQEYDEL